MRRKLVAVFVAGVCMGVASTWGVVASRSASGTRGAGVEPATWTALSTATGSAHGRIPDAAGAATATVLGSLGPVSRPLVGDAPPTCASLQQQASTLRHDNEAMATELRELRRKLGAPAGAQSSRVYGLGEQELVNLAEKCELRWDMPPVENGAPESIPLDDAKTLGLTEAERSAVNAAYSQFNTQTLAQYRALYQQITGDPSPGSMSAGAMISEISSNASRTQLRDIFQRISGERAGLLVPPATPSPPIEQFFRLVVGAGDGFERTLADRIGPDKARALRALHDGFGNKNSSSYGCPN